MINVTVTGTEAVGASLDDIATNKLPAAVKQALIDAVRGIHAATSNHLNREGCAGRKQRLVGPIRGRHGFTKSSGESIAFKILQGAGAYPVPVRTGNLRKSLFTVEPGRTVVNDSGSYQSGAFEAQVVASVKYARVIHEGRGSSKKFGPRPFLTDGFKDFGGREQVVELLRRELAKITI